jgi:hypothetical protein
LLPPFSRQEVGEGGSFTDTLTLPFYHEDGGNIFPETLTPFFYYEDGDSSFLLKVNFIGLLSHFPEVRKYLYSLL